MRNADGEGEASFTSSVVGASFLITVTGFSWAVTQWAPFALVSQHQLVCSMV